jgi:RNA polymerase sporulation-specific sigma factor
MPNANLMSMPSTGSNYSASLDERQDEEVVKLAKDGDEFATEYLITKYKNFVRVKAKSYFLVGADREDIIQEGMIGLYKSIRDYRADKLSSFRAFAELCITRQIITAIKTATRQKHIPLNSYVSLNKPIYDEDSDRTMLDVLSSSKVSDPEEVFISTELSSDLRQKIKKNLSELESQVLQSYLDGKSYQEMAKELNRHVKSIDNALQRVKRKIEKTLGGHDD